MNKLERVYLISIDRSASFRTENINNLKRYIRENLNLDIQTRGIDCIDIINNPDRVKELQQKEVFNRGKNWNCSRNGQGRRFYPGEIGCYLSHLEVWKDMVENKIKHALVFEDDSLIDPNEFFKHLDLIMNNLPHEEYYISLYHPPQNSVKMCKSINDFISKVNFDLWGTVSYILDLKRAELYIKHLIPLVHPLDRAIAYYSIKNSKYLYLSKVPLVGLCDKRSIIRHSKHNS